MIQLTYRDIRDGNFASGLGKLRDYSGFRPKQALKIAHFLKKIRPHEEAGQEVFNKIIEKYATKSEQGGYTQPNGPGSFEVKQEIVENYNKETEEFLDQGFDVECNKLTFKEVEKVNLTPGNLMVMEPCFHNLEVADPQEAANE